MNLSSLKYNNSDVVYWVWLSLACGAGSSAPDALFSRFGRSSKAIYDATPEEYSDIQKLNKKTLTALQNKNLSNAFGIVRWCAENGVGLLPYDSEYFPNSLRIIKDAPVLLYYLGHVPNINHRLSIAVVGRRKVSDYGANNTFTLSYDLAMSGVVIVSGMALGVDGSAHRGALDAGGYTIAVLGSGIDRIYPKEHTNLMHEIAMKGTIITEFCPGTMPLRSNFPTRNRIISGLAQGTVVIEADSHSGSLITAKHAKAQGRPVYALPGNVGEIGSIGTNQLIQEGGILIVDAFDVLENYMESYASVLNADNIMNKLCKYRTSFNYKNVFRATSLPPYPKLGANNSSPGRVYTQSSSKLPHTPIAVEVQDRRYSPLPGSKKKSSTAKREQEKTQKPATAAPEKTVDSSPEAVKNLSDGASAVYKLIPTEGGITYDELIRSYSDRATLMMILTELEMDGLIASGRGGYVRK